MMTLSTMKKVVGTVNEEWRSPLAETILERWGYDDGSVYYFRGSANFLFIFKRNGVTYFLRFSDASEKEMISIESEIKILNYLRDQPLRVALPVKSLNDNYIETVETDIGTFYAVVFEALPGKQFETEELGTGQFLKWGSALGKLHHVFKSMPEEFRESRENWLTQLEGVRGILPEAEKSALHELDELINLAKDLQVSTENFGLIHFDFELDNQRWDEDTIGILDFDDCLKHWYLADIAFALRDLFKDGFDLGSKLVQEFIEGYSMETNLEFDQLQQLPLFMRMHNLVTFAKLLRTVDISPSEDDPEWLSNLRLKLQSYCENYRGTLSGEVDIQT